MIYTILIIKKMKKLVISFLITFTVFISSNGYSQEVDVSMIQNLSSDQIAMAKLKKIHLTRKKL